ncbi:MAG: 2-oxoacid:acceptor oxidoreductase subunit alpha [Anaerolineales bacterium]|nr:2-oxoacid:acceptor oxidoreductase subunit alpha [Anaerolineales bacterium]
MSVTEVETVPRVVAPARGEPVVNDFSISVATKNGSGSQTANTTLLRALFKMGIPVSGKNLFPSNIQGLPTWFTIRVSADGFTARRPRAEIVVAMNPATAIEDHQQVEPGGVFMYADDLKLPLNRTDLAYYPIPAKRLSTEHEADTKLRTYVANMVYVGALAHLLGIALSDIEAALLFHFRGRRKPVDLNMGVVRAASEWAAANLTKQDPYQVAPLNLTEGMIMIDGNTAGALGAIYGGVSFVGWYPITPATGLVDALNHYLPQLRVDPETKTPTYSVIQAEDELAALGMVLGANWAGARGMTATSGPGISLMAEFAGLGYYAEVPVVIWDIQRMGPSTGLPTRVSQGDITLAYYLGHGDATQVCLLPGSVKECFEFGWRAFDLAERLQTPVLVLSDLDLGMNQWMSEPFEYPDQDMDRGKVLSAADLERLGGFARYKDVDGDGIGYRTLPGTDHPLAAYFTRGSGHNERAAYSERPDDWEGNMARLQRKFATARQLVPRPVVDLVEGAEAGLIAFGSTDPAVAEARARLERLGVRVSYLRLRALPLTEEVRQFVRAHRQVYVVEMNADAQVCQLVRLHVPERAAQVLPANKSDGLPLTARWITEFLSAALEKEQRP